MATLKTDLRAAQFDSLRTSEGITGSLTLYRATATGYALLATLTAGWFAQREADQLEGAQYMVIRIAETDANLALITSTINKGIAAAGVMNNRYKIKGKIDPAEDPRVWILRCDPTGEALS